MRREKLRQRKRKAQERDAKKRAKKRGDAKPKEKNAPAGDAAEANETKLSRRQRRAAQVEKRDSDDSEAGAKRQAKSESDTWQEDKKPPSRRAKGKKRAPRR
jgi:hypothetical protein